MSLDALSRNAFVAKNNAFYAGFPITVGSDWEDINIIDLASKFGFNLAKNAYFSLFTKC